MEGHLKITDIMLVQFGKKHPAETADKQGLED